MKKTVICGVIVAFAIGTFAFLKWGGEEAEAIAIGTDTFRLECALYDDEHTVLCLQRFLDPSRVNKATLIGGSFICPYEGMADANYSECRDDGDERMLNLKTPEEFARFSEQSVEFIKWAFADKERESERHAFFDRLAKRGDAINGTNEYEARQVLGDIVFDLPPLQFDTGEDILQ